jgi:hypothetical protein
MSCSVAGNVIIGPVNLLWKAKAKITFDFAASTASGLGGQYVTFYLPDGTGYYAWFDENSTDTDPAPAGFTEIEVDYAASATASAIATAFQGAVDAVTGFVATVDGTVVTVECDDYGRVTAPAGNAVSVVTSICNYGKDYDCGLLQGDVEFNFAPSTVQVTAHQYGPTPLSLLATGFETIEMTTTLLETSNAKLKEIYRVYGGAFTPVSGTEVFGAGSAFIGKNLLSEAGILEARPVGATNSLQSIFLPLAIPIPGTLTFSGENPRVLSVTWQGFIDLNKDSRINAVAFGDFTQNGI